VQKLLWTNLYHTSIKAIDTQHQWMMELINRLLSALERGTDPQSTVRVLMSLVQYAKQHFAEEEELMRASKYPGYARHKSLHDQHLRKLADEVLRLNDGRPVDISAFRNFLKAWLIDHILQEDKKISAHVKANAPELLDTENKLEPTDETVEQA